MPSPTLSRTDGMIWIDQNSPYRLKYHVHDNDYIVETAVTYDINIPAGTSYPAGTVVKLLEKGQVAPAKFPMDINNVLGVVLQDASNSGSSQTAVEVAVGKNGSIIIPQANWESVFVSRDIGTNNTLGITTITDASLAFLKGAPVYWDCGYMPEGGTYIAPLAGKLTVQTPSGFKYRQKTWNHLPQFNIGYNNLPQVGNIIDITATKIEISLTFSAFDETIEWYWPGIKTNTSGVLPATAQDSGTGSGTDSTMIFYHGLFAPTTITDGSISVETGVRCPCRITANDLDDTLELLGHFQHKSGTEGQASSYTTLTYNIPETLNNVYVSGEVIYGFNKHQVE